VAPASELEGMGIDAEPNQRVESGVRALIANPAENRVVDSLLSRYPAIAWDRLAFSAKESVYKLWYPLMRGYLDFLECELEIAVPQAIVCVAGTQIAQGRFYARIKRDVRMNKLTGEWAACAMSGLGYIVTATTLPKGPAATLTKPTAATSTMRED
jgi:4'-phosphopantetheinyl transferase EntD